MCSSVTDSTGRYEKYWKRRKKRGEGGGEGQLNDYNHKYTSQSYYGTYSLNSSTEIQGSHRSFVRVIPLNID